jgi:hypothetical protein
MMELYPLRAEVPQADSKAERVRKTIDFLMEKSISRKEPLLSYFIKILITKNPGDILKTELTRLYYEIAIIYENNFQIRDTVSRSSIDLPFVVLAMNDIEANELFTESIFSDHSIPLIDKEQFLSFKKALKNSQINPDTDLICCYNATRDKWKPVGNERNISDAIDNIIRYIATERLHFDERSIQPKLESEQFFGENSSTRLEIWEQLGESGCILIVDAVSLFHPKLRLKLSNSGLCSKNSTAILIISPLDSYNNSVNRCIEELINSHMELAFSRFSKKWDKLCEIGVGNFIALQRWLYVAIPNEAKIMTDPEPNMKTKYSLRRAMNKIPTDMGQIVAGRRMQ